MQLQPQLPHQTPQQTEEQRTPLRKVSEKRAPTIQHKMYPNPCPRLFLEADPAAEEQAPAWIAESP
jgi:hypothetical protein